MSETQILWGVIALFAGIPAFAFWWLNRPRKKPAAPLDWRDHYRYKERPLPAYPDKEPELNEQSIGLHEAMVAAAVRNQDFSSAREAELHRRAQSLEPFEYCIPNNELHESRFHPGARFMTPWGDHVLREEDLVLKPDGHKWVVIKR